MAQTWPTEDEDFDATTGKEGGDSTQTTTADKPTKTAVKIVDENESENQEEAAPAEEAVADTEPAEAEPEATPEAEAAPEPEPQVADDQPPAAPPAAPAKVSKAPKEPKNRSGMIRIVGEAVLVLAIVGLAFWGWNLSSDNKNLQAQVASLNANPQAVIQKQTDALITQVGKLMNLPTGETPTIANVTDATAAKKQSAFFNNAQNGDKVLMYVKAGEAILYRPSTNKIILVAPLTFNNSTTTTPAASSTTTTKK